MRIGNIEIGEAIRAINPEAKYTIMHDRYDVANPDLTIEWLEGTASISLEDISTKQTELQAEYVAQEYARNREKEYPKIGDQLDYIYHNGITKWKTDMITPVKEKYQKP